MSYQTNGISKNVFVLALIVLAGVLIATGYYLASNRPDGGNSIIGSGRVITSNFNYSGFSEVEIWGGYTVNITHAPSFSVKVTTDDNIINAVYANITGDTLKIGFKQGFSIINPTSLRVEITMPEINGIDLSGGTRTNLYGFLSENQSKIKVDLSGGSTLIGGINVNGNSNFLVSGGSTVQLEGMARDVVVDASGGSTVTLLNYKSRNADLIASGGSTISIYLDGKLDAALSGGSRVYYSGNPTMGDQSVSGGSTITRT